MFRIVCLVIGYFIGCFQTAFIVGKSIGKIDIRDHGSGNAGMTNVMRVMGAKAGLAVFLSDILKMVIAYYLCTLIFNGAGTFMQNGAFSSGAINSYLPGLYSGLGVILGHNYPFYMKFKGGKGISATVGLILCLDIWIALIIYAAAILIIVITRYISLASLVMNLLLPILMLIFNFPPEAIIVSIVIGVLAYYQHRANIVRLFKKSENKFTIKRKSKD